MSLIYTEIAVNSLEISSKDLWTEVFTRPSFWLLWS